nr:hypothetical protein [Frankia sp. Cr2]
MLEGLDIQFVQRPLALPGAVTWLPRYAKTSTGHLVAALRSMRASLVISGNPKVSARATYWAS